MLDRFFLIAFRVIVQITPGINVTMTTSDETSLVQKNCSSREQLSPPPMNFELFSRDGFEIDWCHFVVSFKTSRCQASS